VSDAVRRPCSDFMDMLRRLINYRIIIIIIIIINPTPCWHLTLLLFSVNSHYDHIHTNTPWNIKP